MDVIRIFKENYGQISRKQHLSFQVPIIIPSFVLVISIYLIIAPIIDNPTIEYLYAALFILGGMVFYVPFVHYQIKTPFMGKIEILSINI